MTVFEYTNKGNIGEDQGCIIHDSLPNGSGLFIVADGMGIYKTGMRAAYAVADYIQNYIKLNYEKEDPSDLLLNSITLADDLLFDRRSALWVLPKGCVITILMICDGYAFLSWLGDRRIQLFRNGKGVFHSALNEFPKIKNLGTDSIENYAGIVTKYHWGEEPLDKAPVVKIEICDGDVFILCSDGIHKEMDIEKVLNYDGTQKEYLDSISEKMNDNYSFIKVII